jgi:hypothetical protein
MDYGTVLGRRGNAPGPRPGSQAPDENAPCVNGLLRPSELTVTANAEKGAGTSGGRPFTSRD